MFYKFHAAEFRIIQSLNRHMYTKFVASLTKKERNCDTTKSIKAVAGKFKNDSILLRKMTSNVSDGLVKSRRKTI